MSSAFKRGIERLGQRTGELLGIDTGRQIEVSEEFKDLLFETDHRHSATENVHAALLLYSNQLLKKKDASDHTKLKLYLLENLGSSMVRLGAGLPKDSPYGRAMRELGQAEERMSEQQIEFVNAAKEGWVPSLQRSLDDFKEYVALQKKLETRRGEYDSRLVKFQRARKDNMAVEDDLRTAQIRYEDAYDDLAKRMLEMQDNETECLREAFNFYQAQLAYHQNCVKDLNSLGAVFDECLKAKRAPAAERHPLGRALDSRRAALTIKTGDTPTSARFPISFGKTASTTSLSRMASQSTPLKHLRNGSQQPSEISIEVGASTPDADAGPVPQVLRANSDNDKDTALPGKRQVPTVSARRHVPAPPTPARGQRRVLRKAIYKFHADELGELALEKGDIVVVTETIQNKWLKGKLVYSAVSEKNEAQAGVEGLFPEEYTEPCSESDLKSLQAADKSGAPQRSASITSAPATAATKTAKTCACGCSDFVPNKFKEDRCSKCFHDH
ncbi:hypothetical protein H4217_003457 [Coemansia sp. RSA 1939]|nr:hypothetical protein H4217_003457 [Coemansia sp. RSA 1939]KAJ2611810.1 hypothetical protein EV177_003306 [Coemansia sp. RSA 1804]KAJ2691432.1 hypothetical protein GGH99_002427 [Coemansia sp. RSA 1285]